MTQFFHNFQWVDMRILPYSLSCDGPRLQQDKFAVSESPLNIHRLSVKYLYLHAEFCEGFQLRVCEARHILFRNRHCFALTKRAYRIGILAVGVLLFKRANHLGFFGNCFFDNFPCFSRNLKIVWGNFSGDNGFAESPIGFDDADVFVKGTYREEHA